MEEGQALAAPSIEDRVSAALFPPKREAPAEQAEPEAPVETEAPEESAAPEEEQTEETPVEEAQDDVSPLEWDKIKDSEIEITVQGEKSKVSLEEARLGYMRTADYQRKTQEVATQRREVVEQARQAINATQEQYGKQLGTMQAALQRLALSEFQGVNMNELAASNPAEYVRMQHRVNQFQALQQQLASESQQAEQKRTQESQQTRAQALEQAREDLMMRIPDFNDSIRAALFKTGAEYGFSEQELVGVIDARMLHILNDARQLRELKASKPLVTKRVAEAPKVIKPGAKVANNNRNQSQELKDRVRKSAGKDEGALLALIKKSF